MIASVAYQIVESPIGELLLLSDGTYITGLFMAESAMRPSPLAAWMRTDRPFAAARVQLGEYFEGSRRHFDLPLAMSGTPFQRRVWAALAEIPYGETASYAQIALHVGSPRAVRAVGAANGRNPLSIFIPCHRVIGTDGSLTGYGGGLWRKEFLLGLEGTTEPGRARIIPRGRPRVPGSPPPRVGA